MNEERAFKEPLHLLPCEIEYTGSANVSKYFHVQEIEHQGVHKNKRNIAW